MPRTLIKICGITRIEDALRAGELGVDYLGLNLVAGPRRISLETAASIRQAQRPGNAGAPPGLKWIALCADRCTRFPDALRWTDALPLAADCLQVYSDDYAADLNATWWMVRHLDSRTRLQAIAAELSARALRPEALLLDTASSDKLGGTGQTFNWQWIAEARDAGDLRGLPPIVLAGGLTPDNVAEAIRLARPHAVDVSSGVEVAGKPGIKDAVKLRDFVQAVRGATA